MTVLFILALVVIFNKWVYKSFFNPVLLQSFIWFVYYLFLYLNIDKYDVSLSSTYYFILPQLFGFSLGGFIAFALTPTIFSTDRLLATEDSTLVLKENIRLLYPLFLTILIISLLFLFKQSGSAGISKIGDFREQLTEDDGKKFGTFGLIQLILSVFAILLVYVEKKFNFKLILFLAMFLYFTLLLGSKGQFVFFFAALLYLLQWNNRVNKYLLSSIVGLIVFFIIFLTISREGAKRDLSNEFLLDVLLIYTVTAIPALHLLKPRLSTVFGYQTFRVGYVWINKLGFDYALSPILSEYTLTPLPTNVYSYLKPYFADFGFWGIVILPLILGFIHNIIYFKANQGKVIASLMNSLLIYPIIMQVFEENYFRQLSNWVYIVLLIYLLTKVKFKLSKQK